VSPLLTVHSSSASSSSALASIRSICFIFSILRRDGFVASSVRRRPHPSLGRSGGRTHARIIVAPSRERVGIINY